MTPQPVALQLPDFEAWVASSPQPAAVLRWADHVVVAANAALLALLGLPRAALLGQADASTRLWAQPQQRQQLWDALATGAQAGRFAVTWCGPGAVPLALVAAAHRVQLGGTPHVVLMLAGLPDTETSLQALVADWRYVEAAAPLGTWDFDLVSGQVHWSPGLEALYGIPSGSFGGQYEDFMRYLHPADLQRVDRDWRAALAAPGPISMQFRIVRPDGRVRWVACRVEAYFGPDGKPLRVHGLNMDVTEDRRREQGLRLSETIIGHMPEGVLLCRTSDACIVYASPRYEAMLGFAAGELLGRHASVVNSPAEADPAETGRQIVADLRRAGVWTGTVRNRRKDGREIWVRAAITTFEHDEHGPVWLCVNADVTDAYLAQQAREQAAADLQRLAASVQETIEAERAALSRDVHDQLGAALAGMRMRLEAVASRVPAKAEWQRAEILAIARLAQDATVQTRDICSRLRPAALDDLGIVETCRWYVGEWARHAGLHVKRRLPQLRPEPGPGVSIDIFRVLQELLTNVARHASATEVKVALLNQAGHLVLRVADNGVGIAPQRQGQGLGLLGARERVQRHGGKLVIESSPGGTTVTVIIATGGNP